MLIINQWLGRLGQNILQILRAIHFAKTQGHTNIQFPQHPLLNSTTISLNKTITDNGNIIKHNFFYLHQIHIKDTEPYIYKQYFQKYIRPIFKLNYKEGCNDNIYIHIRSEDLYNINPHSKHIGSPLAYYNYIIDNYYKDKQIIIIANDTIDPCIDILCKRSNVSFFSSQDLLTDLEQFTNIKHLIISIGLFDFLLYLLNEQLETLFMPDFTYSELIEGSYGTNIDLNIINIPNYIKLGEWTASSTQRQLMLDYILPNPVIITKF
jgi:hypothetical protein